MLLAIRRKLAWDRDRKRPTTELLKRRMDTVNNGINVARGSLRQQTEAEIALAAERRRRVRNMSAKAKKVANHVARQLKERGYEFKLYSKREAGIITRLVKVEPLRPKPRTSKIGLAKLRA